ncbi:hypothetical protein B0H10DRAFT_2434500 [Mycena sp. CBHHK59/15]|nr:hypothetical protein B0H10DRAFT_2434500 [Mycena sp. CBHHK59/15]
MLVSSKLCLATFAFTVTTAVLSNVQAPNSSTLDSSDTAPFTIALFSTNPSYNSGFAVANNVNPQDNKATIALPDVVPSMSDTSDVLATSLSFSRRPYIEAHQHPHPQLPPSPLPPRLSAPPSSISQAASPSAHSVESSALPSVASVASRSTSSTGGACALSGPAAGKLMLVLGRVVLGYREILWHG